MYNNKTNSSSRFGLQPLSKEQNLHFSYIFLSSTVTCLLIKHVTVDEKDVRKVQMFVPLIKAVSRNVRKS